MIDNYCIQISKLHIYATTIFQKISSCSSLIMDLPTFSFQSYAIILMWTFAFYWLWLHRYDDARELNTSKVKGNRNSTTTKPIRTKTSNVMMEQEKYTHTHAIFVFKLKIPFCSYIELFDGSTHVFFSWFRTSQTVNIYG